MQTRSSSLVVLLAGSIVACSNGDTPLQPTAPIQTRASIKVALTAKPEAAGITASVAGAHGVGRKLMIIGNMTDEVVGNVTDDAIFIDRIAADVGGPKQMRVLVVAGASAGPAWLYSYFQQVMPTRGIPVDHIALAHIASIDDSSTPDVDESTWIRGAYLPSEVAKVAAANVIWFDGGVQTRLVALLLDSNGKDSPFQAAIKAKLAANNLIIAGYSAGAAIMSDPMIASGTSWGSLTMPLDPTCESDDQLCVARGLGYLPQSYSVLVDQHFTQRGRFARSIRAMAATDKHNVWGVGEFSGFYVDLAQKQAEVVGVPGKAFVTIMGRDGSTQNHERLGPPFLGDNYTMSILGVGDTYALPDPSHPHGVGAHPTASEDYAPFSAYYSDNPILTDALGYQVLVNDVAVYFADGTPQASGARVDSIAFLANESGSATGFLFRFTADANSTVAWNEDVGYSIFNARLKIATMSGHFVGLGP
jgi:cyanophycinase